MKFSILLFFLFFYTKSSGQSLNEIKLDYYFNGYKIVDSCHDLTAAFFIRNDTLLSSEHWTFSHLDSLVSFGVTVLGRTALFEEVPIARFKDHARIDVIVYDTDNFKKAPRGYLKKYGTNFKRKSRRNTYVTFDGKEYVIRKNLMEYKSVVIINFFHQTDNYISRALIAYVYFVK